MIFGNGKSTPKLFLTVAVLIESHSWFSEKLRMMSLSVINVTDD
jgi:hypothetical protein